MANGNLKISGIFQECGIPLFTKGRRANDNKQPAQYSRSPAEIAAKLNEELKTLQDPERRAVLEVILENYASTRMRLVQLEEERQRDKMTGLLNIETFIERVNELIAMRDRGEIKTFSIIMADLRGLKAMNDKINRQTGDASIKEAANCLQHAVRGDDFCGRGGGGSDEFLICLVDAGTESHDIIAQRLQRNLSNTWIDAYEKDFQIRIDMVFGMVEAQPGQSAEQIIHAADQLMCKAKAASKQTRDGYILTTRLLSDQGCKVPLETLTLGMAA